jgi:hypothetical protein
MSSNSFNVAWRKCASVCGGVSWTGSRSSLNRHERPGFGTNPKNWLTATPRNSYLLDAGMPWCNSSRNSRIKTNGYAFEWPLSGTRNSSALTIMQINFAQSILNLNVRRHKKPSMSGSTTLRLMVTRRSKALQIAFNGTGKIFCTSLIIGLRMHRQSRLMHESSCSEPTKEASGIPVSFCLG